ncbi:MAG: AsmA family protein, partial [Betaproteobacteria bacterium]|nr:AsmA family protein [Betaproteobacteria bacterium]
MIPLRLASVPHLMSKAVLALLALVVLLAGLIVYVALAGIAIDGGLYRKSLQNMLSEQLGRAVHLDGAVELQISLKPALRVRHVRIAQPEEFGSADFVRVGELQVRLDLWPLVHRQFKADTLFASGVSIFLKQRADGANNWTFPNFAEPPGSSPAGSSDPDILPKEISGIDIRKVELRDLNVEFRGVNDKPVFFELTKFDASLPVDGALRATAEGNVDKTMPYAIKIDGGRLSDLVRGKSAWPVSLQLDFAGGLMTANGSLSQADTQLRFGLGTPDLGKFGLIIGVDLPDAGNAGIAGALQVRPGQVEIRQLSGALGKSLMTGELFVDTRQERTRLSGALTLPVLDLRPFLGQDTEEEPPTDFRALYLSLAKARLDLQQLNQYDADLSLTVDKWLSLPGDTRKSSLSLRLDAGKLSIPVKATIASVALEGEINVDATHAVPAFGISLGAENARVGSLAQLLTGLPGIDGQLGRLKISLSSEGSNGQVLMKKLASRFELNNSRLSYGNVTGGKPVNFIVDKMLVELPSENTLRGSFKGQLLGKPLEAKLAGDDLVSIVKSGSSPIEFIVQSGRVSARVAGMLNASQGTAQLQFSLGASHAGDVADWLGLSPDARAPVALAGQLHMAEDQ